MIEKELPDLSGSVIFFTGIKGTGMTALAEIFRSRGAIVTGSDVDEHFYTDEILTQLGIPVFKGFSPDNIPESTDLLVYSAAYSLTEHPELTAASARGIRMMSYAEALGSLSRMSRSAAIAGVHGKTTTTAMTGTILNALELPASILTGSAAANFGGRSTLVKGNDYFVAETCEYKRNFLNFSPQWLVITSVEPDHLDYYRDYDDILSAFVEYGMKLSNGGALIYCADDAGASEAAERIRANRDDVRLVPYGLTVDGDFGLTDLEKADGETRFKINRFPSVKMKLLVPGTHNVLNAAAAIAVACQLLDIEDRGRDSGELISEALAGFRGTKRRSEILGSSDDIIFMDDYGHHPAAIKTTLHGLRDFYPKRRIIVDFMSHTYSRTEALLDDFSKSFDAADVVILHKIYASAREKQGTVRGQDLYEQTKKNHSAVQYFEEVMDAKDFVINELKPGDLFVTMGAGDNWKLGESVYSYFKEEQYGCTE